MFPGDRLYVCMRYVRYFRAVARGREGGPMPPPSFFAPKVKTHMHQKLKTKFHLPTV